MLKKILIVDDVPNNLQVLRQILKGEYQLIFAPSGEKALSATIEHLPDIILLDIMMPEMDGYEVCKRLKADELTAHIPVIFITALGEMDDEALGFDVGGVDYIIKPVSGPIVKRRIKTHLSLVRAEKLEKLAYASVQMLGIAGHYNDTDTGQHIWRMADYAAALAEKAGVDCEEVETIRTAAPMHDTGKIGIPDAILKAPRALTEDEWKIMKCHSAIGHKILSQSDNPVFKMAADIAMAHHEKWDGSGYPKRQVGEDIPLPARITAIADVFDALTVKRPYKEPWPIDEAFQTISDDAGSHFDPTLVKHFLEIKEKILEIKDKWEDE